MKMKCLFKSVLRGEIVKVGQVIDLNDAELKTDVVKKFFVKVDDGTGADSVAAPVAVQPAKSTTVVAGLTRDQAILKLQQNGVSVKGNVSNKALIDLYNTTFANAAEATSKSE